MKTQKDKDLTLIFMIIDRFPTDDKAREHPEGIRWKSAIVCPHCKCADEAKFSAIAANPEKKIRAGLALVLELRKQFTVNHRDHIFEDSHIPLRKWLIAWYLICSSKKGISSLQFTTAPRAWQLSHGAVYGSSNPIRA